MKQVVNDENIDEIFESASEPRYEEFGYKVWFNPPEKDGRRINVYSPRIGHSSQLVPTGMWNYWGFYRLNILTNSVFPDRVPLNINNENYNYQGTFVLMGRTKFREIFGFDLPTVLPNELLGSVEIKGGATEDIRYLGRQPGVRYYDDIINEARDKEKRERESED